MKILIGQSYFRALDPKELNRETPYPPLGSLYAATILRDLSHRVVFYDAMLGSGPDQFLRMIKSEKPDLLIIYDDEFNYLTKMCLSNMRGAALTFISKAKELSIPVIVYSSDATDFPDSYLKAGCEAIIYGEGEITLQEVVGAIESKRFTVEKYSIPGLKFLKDGEIHSTIQRKLIGSLDILPNPDYDFVDIKMFKDIWISKHGYFSINISTTRGCPFSCNWCAKPLYGRTYTSRSPEDVVLQIKELKAKYGIDHIWITDDIFGLKPNWIKQFSDMMKLHGISIRYKCLSRPDLLLKDNTLDELKKSGCETIWIGAESGSQKILDSMDKGTRVSQIYEASQKIHTAGMQVAFFIQFGYSGENRDDISMTREMIRRCLPDDIGISVSYPLPGTIFYERVKEQMKWKTNWNDSDDLDMIFNGTFNRSFYKTLHRMVHYEYRMIKLIRQKQYRHFDKAIYYLIKFLYLRIKLNKYLSGPNTGSKFKTRMKLQAIKQ